MNERDERRLKQLRRALFHRALPFFRKHQPLPPSVARIAAEYMLTFLLAHDAIECAAAHMQVTERELRSWIRVARAPLRTKRRRRFRRRGELLRGKRQQRRG